jgi:hypothetical protein
VKEGMGINMNGIEQRDACIADQTFDNKNCSSLVQTEMV